MASLKNMVYHFLAPVLRTVFHNSITGKPIHGTGFNLYYDKSQHLGFFFQRSIQYEREISSQILNQIQQDNLVFEIGSNIGQYSLLIAEKIGDQGKLICVEPDSDNYAFLQFNMLKNNVQNVELLHTAVADVPGSAVFYKDTITGGRTGSLIQKYASPQSKGKMEEVKVTTFLDLVKLFGIPDFVKVDVEGAEDKIFFNSSVIEDRTTYLIEIRKETKSHIFEIFHQRKFHIYVLEQKSFRVQTVEEIPDFANLLMRKKEI